MSTFDDVTPVEDNNSEVAATPDLDVILPTADTLVVDGIPATVNRLKMRELIALGTVITKGIGPAASNIKFTGTDTTDTITTVLLLALPNAIEEFCAFLATVVTAKNPEDAAALSTYLKGNPEIEELLDVLAVLVEQEQSTIGSLLGKLQGIMALMSKTAK